MYKTEKKEEKGKKEEEEGEEVFFSFCVHAFYFSEKRDSDGKLRRVAETAVN